MERVTMSRVATLVALSTCLIAAAPAAAAGHASAGGGPHARKYAAHAPPGGARSSAPTFSTGQLQASAPGASGCGTNNAGEPAIHVSRADNVFAASEDGIGSGSELWRGVGALGSSGASGCGLEYRGQPNAIAQLGAAGGDVDVALASAPNASGNYNVYVSSLNLGSVNVATSQDNAISFNQFPLQIGVPLDDRPFIAAFGADTSLLTYRDVATGNIDVLRSDSDGVAYQQVSRVIPETDYKAGTNQIGNIVIDHRNLPDQSGGFYAYQSYVAPSSASGSQNNEAFLGVSADGGRTWSNDAIPCSTSPTGSLDHNFPNVSVDPLGNVWYSWSDDHNIRVAKSSDHGRTWTCSAPVSTNTGQAIFPWLAATSRGVDLVYYGSPTPAGKGTQTWYVYFTQALSGSPSGFRAPQQVVPVHKGSVCESGATCNGGRQLFDDFGIDTDRLGYAHIAYSHDSPDLGGAGTYTGYGVQTGGTTVGSPNN